MSKLIAIAGNTPERQYELSKEEIVIGRAVTSDIYLNSASVSRNHAKIVTASGSATIFDNHSANGTLVNGVSVAQHTLGNGDKIYIGDYIFKFEGEMSQRLRVPIESTLGGDVAPTAPDSAQSVSVRYEDKTLWQKISHKLNVIDWKAKIGICIGLYVLFVHFFVTDYLISKSTQEFFLESEKRARTAVQLLAVKNAEALKNNTDILLDAESVLSEEGVSEAFIADERLRIRAPSSLFGQSITDPISKEALFQDRTIDDFPEVTRASKFLTSLSAKATFTISSPIKVWNEASANFKTIGIAKISFLPMKLIESHLNRQDFQRNSLMISIIPALVIFFGILFFTTKPMNAATEEVENVIKGLQTRITENGSFKELSFLAESINRVIEKIGQTASSPSEMGMQAQGGASTEFYRMREWESIINCLNDGVIIIDPQNSIAMVNMAAVRLLKLDQAGGMGRNVFETIEVTDVTSSLRKLSEEIIDKSIDEPPPEEIEYGGPGSILKIQALGLRESFGQIVATVFIFTQY